VGVRVRRLRACGCRAGQPEPRRFAAGVRTGTADAHLGKLSRRHIERAKWCLWHGRWKRCLVRLATTYRRTEATGIRDAVGIETLRRHLRYLTDYLEANRATLVNYAARRRRYPDFRPVNRDIEIPDAA
jgi:hypothetical protein